MRRNRLIAAAAVAVAVTAGGAGLAVATGGGDDDEAPITGGALERATTAALAHTGGGRVTDTEVGDEDSYYEVEVTLAGGGQVDVQLDEEFTVVGAEDDKDGPEDDRDDQDDDGDGR